MLAAAMSLAAQSGRTPALFFDGGRLIVGDGRTIEHAAFVVEGETIARVGRQNELKLPAGASRVDMTGRTIMPAMIDAHTHLGYRAGTSFSADNFTRDTILEQLNRLAAWGVTAVASAGTDRGDLTLQLRASPPPTGAVVRTAWRGLAPPDAGPNPPMRDAPFAVTSEDDVRRDVRELAAKRVDFVKIWVDDRNGTVPKLSPTLYRAIIREAHAQGLRVVAHIATLADAKSLLRAGVDGFLHPVRDRDVDEELLQLLKERPQVFFTPTLFAPRFAAYDAPPAWLDDPRLPGTAAPAEIERVKATVRERAPAAIQTARAEWETIARNVARLNAVGVRLALGTDVGGASAGGLFGVTEHVELEHMVTAGLTPMQAIVAATRTAADVLRLPELGTIAVGKRADFIVLSANPIDAIANTRRIVQVYARGKALPSGERRPSSQH